MNIPVLLSSEAANRGVLWKKSVLGNFKKFAGKHVCQSVYFNKVAGLRPLWYSGTGVFLWICEISKNTFFTDNVWTTASVSSFGNLFSNLGLAIYAIRITHWPRKTIVWKHSRKYWTNKQTKTMIYGKFATALLWKRSDSVLIFRVYFLFFFLLNI